MVFNKGAYFAFFIYFYRFYHFGLIVKLCWDQLVLNNEGKVSWSRKQRKPLMGFELTTK